MKKTYEKPILVKGSKLQAVAAQVIISFLGEVPT